MSTTNLVEARIDVHLTEADLDAALRRDVCEGLLSSPKELPPKWLYDEHGSELFDAITRLDEYYPTEAERQVLLQRADEIIDRVDAETIVELGSGTSDKTSALLDAARRHGRLRRFIPFDVSEPFLRDSADSVAERYPGLLVHGVVGDFDHHLDQIPPGGRRLVVLLGSTIGNYPPVERRDFLARISSGLERGTTCFSGPIW